MKKTTVVDFGDILEFAESTLGIPWNYAHALIDGFYPSDGSFELYCTDIKSWEPLGHHIRPWVKLEPYDMSAMGRDVMHSFMQEHALKEMTIIR